MAVDEESQVDTPQASHPNPQSTSTVIQYPSSGTITANLTTSEAVSTQENILIEESEARQAAQTTEATQLKKRGRRPSSKNRQPRKKRAKKALEQEGGREEEQDTVDYDGSIYAFLQELSHEPIDLV